MFSYAFYVTALVIIGLWTALAIAVAPVRHSRIRKQKEKEAAAAAPAPAPAKSADIILLEEIRDLLKK